MPRCPNGTRKNPRTGNCDKVKVSANNNIPKMRKQRSNKGKARGPYKKRTQVKANNNKKTTFSYKSSKCAGL